ncbi:DUF1330 domain-containing protein [Sphingobium sp.]|uniref:DUF1330 domain-containing protein n=1 Tax=Sphingobium sp. TaxID=1912891 RepID=UPI0028BEAD9F|nr:DUF1330 domain-containing protein [Sphingobium sp.]
MAISEILVVVEVQEIFDAAQFESYRAQARQQLMARGGLLLARGGELFEGSPPLAQSVLVQCWPSEDAFRAWQESEDYAPLLKLRTEAARLRITIVPAAS